MRIVCYVVMNGILGLIFIVCIITTIKWREGLYHISLMYLYLSGVSMIRILFLVLKQFRKVYYYYLLHFITYFVMSVVFSWCKKILRHITKTSLFKYIENFTTKKWKFSDKNSDIFHISAQNIDCGYSLEPPRRGGSNEYPQSMFLSRNKKIMYTPVNPSFTM